MKRAITLTIAAVVLAVSFVVPSTVLKGGTSVSFEAHAQSLPAHHGEECTAATFEGTYVYKHSGFNTNFGPFAGIGIFTSDGQGNVQGSGTISRNGEISQGPFERTYVVNSDCTGSAFTNDVLVGNFILSQDGREYVAINMISGRTIIEEGKRQQK